MLRALGGRANRGSPASPQHPASPLSSQALRGPCAVGLEFRPEPRFECHSFILWEWRKTVLYTEIGMEAFSKPAKYKGWPGRPLLAAAGDPASEGMEHASGSTSVPSPTNDELSTNSNGSPGASVLQGRGLSWLF